VKDKIQKFGGAMFTPVMLLSFSGIILAITIIFQNPIIMGSIAEEGTLWYKIWDIVSAGMWTVFENLELLFAIALPIGLAKKSLARISMESFVVYMAFNYFVGAILENFGGFFGVDFSAEPEAGSGLKLIGGIKTLDTGVIGAIIIALMVVYLHDHFFDKKIPDWLAMFNGSSLVVFLGMMSAIVVALIFCFIWPVFQRGMGNIQTFFVGSGGFGIWCYSLLERLLLPTGLHHLLTQPFSYGPVIVNEGITTYWLDHLVEFSQSSRPLAELFPGAAFKLYGHNKIFAAPGVAAALYFTSKSENKKKTGALVIPAAIAAIVGGITEPLEFTFLFISPPLYAVYAVLCATLSTAQYAIGIRGDFTSGLITWLAKNWIPLWHNHYDEYIKQIIVGLIFTVIFFVVFYFLIIKFDIKTPGRQLAAATYMSGIGGGSAMVIAPLAFAAVGVVPELIAAMSLAAAVSFTTSPASLESSIVSQLGEFEVASYVSTMRPYWILFVILAMILAFWGTKHRGVGFKEEENDKYAEMSNGKLWRFTFPAIFLLFAVILGPVVNSVIGFELFTPLFYMIVTLFLIYLCTDFPLNKSVDAMIDGSTYILTRLFQVGIFLAFINVIAQTGTFSVIAGLASSAPTVIMVPVAVLTGILIGVPAGAYVGSVLTLVLPVAVSLGFSPLALGFVAMGVGMGSQMSFVNITMQALSSGFQLPILDIVKGNVKWISIASVLLLIISFIFA